MYDARSENVNNTCCYIMNIMSNNWPFRLLEIMYWLYIKEFLKIVLTIG